MGAKKSNSKCMLPTGRLQLKESFFKASHEIFCSERYLNLTHVQRNLLFDLCATHDGKNNGNLQLTPTFAKSFRWSYHTIKENKQALLDSGLVRLVGVKRLSRNRTMNLYALAWLPIDEDCNEHITEEAKQRPILNLKKEIFGENFRKCK